MQDIGRGISADAQVVHGDFIIGAPALRVDAEAAGPAQEFIITCAVDEGVADEADSQFPQWLGGGVEVAD